MEAFPEDACEADRSLRDLVSLRAKGLLASGRDIAVVAGQVQETPEFGEVYRYFVRVHELDGRRALAFRWVLEKHLISALVQNEIDLGFGYRRWLQDLSAEAGLELAPFFEADATPPTTRIRYPTDYDLRYEGHAFRDGELIGPDNVRWGRFGDPGSAACALLRLCWEDLVAAEAVGLELAEGRTVEEVLSLLQFKDRHTLSQQSTNVRKQLHAECSPFELAKARGNEAVYRLIPKRLLNRTTRVQR